MDDGDGAGGRWAGAGCFDDRTTESSNFRAVDGPATEGGGTDRGPDDDRRACRNANTEPITFWTREEPSLRGAGRGVLSLGGDGREVAERKDWVRLAALSTKRWITPDPSRLAWGVLSLGSGGGVEGRCWAWGLLATFANNFLRRDSFSFLGMDEFSLGGETGIRATGGRSLRFDGAREPRSFATRENPFLDADFAPARRAAGTRWFCRFLTAAPW